MILFDFWKCNGQKTIAIIHVVLTIVAIFVGNIISLYTRSTYDLSILWHLWMRWWLQLPSWLWLSISLFVPWSKYWSVMFIQGETFCAKLLWGFQDDLGHRPGFRMFQEPFLSQMEWNCWRIGGTLEFSFIKCRFRWVASAHGDSERPTPNQLTLTTFQRLNTKSANTHNVLTSQQQIRWQAQRFQRFNTKSADRHTKSKVSKANCWQGKFYRTQNRKPVTGTGFSGSQHQLCCQVQPFQNLNANSADMKNPSKLCTLHLLPGIVIAHSEQQIG